jgi:hypothetical protein
MSILTKIKEFFSSGHFEAGFDAGYEEATRTLEGENIGARVASFREGYEKGYEDAMQGKRDGQD